MALNSVITTRTFKSLKQFAEMEKKNRQINLKNFLKIGVVIFTHIV